jgi:hypothetical protein
VAAPARAAAYWPSELDGLPPPVRRYFEAALTPGQRVVAGVTCTQEGTFLIRPPSTWRPFRATQRFETLPPSFRWDARIRAFPGVGIAVHDTFADGQGSISARFLGVVPLASSAGTPEMAKGALQRYLAEAVLMPTALLPREGVVWTQLGEASARATLTVGATAASVELSFGADAMVASVFAPDRPREVGGRTVPTPWRGRWWEYALHGGARAPTRGEVEWLLPEGPLPYWRATVSDFRSELR